jgi:hypothetical protein
MTVQKCASVRAAVWAISLGMLLVIASTNNAVAAQQRDPIEVPPPFKNASDYCSQYLEELIEMNFRRTYGTIGDVSHGSCMALVQTGNATPLAVDVCHSRLLADRSKQFRDLFVNKAECLRFVKAQYAP